MEEEEEKLRQEAETRLNVSREAREKLLAKLAEQEEAARQAIEEVREQQRLALAEAAETEGHEALMLQGPSSWRGK
jgi:hypothetical protein